MEDFSAGIVAGGGGGGDVGCCIANILPPFIYEDTLRYYFLKWESFTKLTRTHHNAVAILKHTHTFYWKLFSAWEQRCDCKIMCKKQDEQIHWCINTNNLLTSALTRSFHITFLSVKILKQFGRNFHIMCLYLYLVLNIHKPTWVCMQSCWSECKNQ